MPTRPSLILLALMNLPLAACRTTPPKALVPSLQTSVAKGPPRLELDGKRVSDEVTRGLIFESPIAILHSKASVAIDGRELQAHVLRSGDHVYIHSHRSLWSPRASGQAFFDTFLFGCKSLPPSPLDRVVNEGVRLEAGDSVLIEEYPDRVATPTGQDFAWIKCVN